MKNLKCRVLLSCGLLLAALTSGCAGSAESSSVSALSSQESASTQSESTSQAAETDAESEEQLYQQALEQGGVISVYSASTGITNRAKETFEAQYPGLTVEVTGLGTQKLLAKLIEEQSADIYDADCVLIKEQGGSVKHDLVDTGMLIKYIPEDIAENMTVDADELMGYRCFSIFKTIAYNTDVYDTCPVTNWWDLTTEEWNGRIFMNDPSKGGPQMDFICGFLMNPDAMEQAYIEKFGGEPDLEGQKNAGYLFVKKLAENAVLTADDQVMFDAVSNSTAEDPKLAIVNSNDLQGFIDEKLPIAVTWEIAPCVSLINDTYLFLAKNAANEAGAKLFIRWMAGGSDGTAEGIKAVLGAGSFVSVNTPFDTQTIQLNDISLFPYDPDAYYQNYVTMVDYWNSLA